MKKDAFNKSVSTKTNKTLKLAFKGKKELKPISIKYSKFLKLNDEFNSNYNNYINRRYYYKNPEFLNSSNIQKQINILLTNINQNNFRKNGSLTNLKKLPKIKSLPNLDKSENTSCDSPFNTRLQNININKYPSISKSNNNIYNSYNNKAKDIDYIYKSIFTNSSLFKEKPHYIDNKLNIVYCQNESQYKFIMEKRNKMENKGSILKFEEDSEKIKERVDDIKEKIKFMKNIMDYSYPSFMVTKIKSCGKNFPNQINDELQNPVEARKKQIIKRNNLRTIYLKQNLNIFPLKI